jgi:hypothetical protein
MSSGPGAGTISGVYGDGHAELDAARSVSWAVFDVAG